MAKTKSKKIVIMIIILILIATFLVVVFIRVNPKWKAAELTIVQAEKKYDIKSIDPEGTTLQTRILPPEGYNRVDAEEGSFAAYLRDYPLYPDGTALPVFDGRTKESPYTAAVFDISVGDEGYQQCADSIIRLYSDYCYENGNFDDISFQLSNGDVCSYNRWRKGRRILALGDFSCEIPAALPDDSEQQYRNYLKLVMRYAGTLSLLDESKVISVDELRTGDIICNKTHVVMVLDTAVNDKGEKCYLLGQSFIPAVCFHVVNNVDGKDGSPWFTEAELRQETFSVGGFKFSSKNDIRRWKS
ncbi:DUF4846 domain-containing protein [Ruminococcus albus]|uniref:DUF4846 domain-containing protein n=1 Tax=Ruminococcus albus TaxID=1264 RepID=A0A1H7JQH3_RUMAL|nr:DUF4846 domain-containing protein [Ruminococcus albus]SEK76762.1 protein of unknown function (4846) [Ruminococcus albus]